MQVRTATLVDAKAIAEAQVHGRRAGYAPFFDAAWLAWLDVDKAAAMWAQRIEGLVAPETGLVCEIDGGVRGFAWVAPNECGLGDRTGELVQLYVHPDWWQRGAGSALIDAAEAHMAAAGFTDAVLWVYPPNTRARRFYEARGWAHDGAEQTVDRGTPQVQMRYRKPLG